tara:strand:+ start:351 stop:659 length:309 start_codon:yes stop_codon:yes gene_type:complete
LSYSKQTLAEAKQKLKEKDPAFFNRDKTGNRSVKRKVDVEIKKKIIKWSYKVNDIVTCTSTKRIGLIVSDNEYFGRKIEENYYYVLFGEAVLRSNGKALRKV